MKWIGICFQNHDYRVIFWAFQILEKNYENISFYLQKLTKLECHEDNNELTSMIMVGQ